ncbi:ATP-dependent Clp protease proteolytic subunit 6, chloroplastic-like [Panicum virgatum]|uniref:ATP-dependent Clp protease proteolytic subunit n=1 Tax=Panicum virgatum TaxID=38727 RepID=A0A8T0NS08_PANVG|nr:ATP-dependent Clp protease proteolytic subunit 6, chloroplastic-like [Panicum virgatum]KAG2551335.1 hypothetical protein PVAP13_9KG392400 [Panicum virgatum]
MAPMATISAPLAACAAPSGLRPHRRNGARARLGLRGVKFVSHGVSSQQDERKRCHSSLRKNTIVASENENPPLMPAIMTPGGPLDLETVLLGNRVIFIGQYINSQVAQRVISQLVTLATVDEEGDILIYLNCPGGSLYSILAIYDCMSWIKPKVGTVGFGVVASQAAIILAGGEKGMRYAMPNTRVMIHQPQGGSEGNVEEVRRQVGETIYARDKVDKMFAAFTGQPLDMVQQWTERDRFMSSSEAMDFGLVDALLETRY